MGNKTYYARKAGGLCPACGNTKPQPGRVHCGACAERARERTGRTRHKENPTRRAERRRRSEYGLSGEDYARMVTEQGGNCAICGAAGNLVIDHCHATGRVRGLLCNNCNAGLGMFGDAATRVREAAEYLTREYNSMD